MFSYVTTLVWFGLIHILELYWYTDEKNQVHKHQLSAVLKDIQNVTVQMLQEILSSSIHAFVSCYVSTPSHCKYK